MANKFVKFLILFVIVGFATTACKPKSKKAKYYVEANSAQDKAKLQKGLAYHGKDGKLYNPVSSLKSAPKAAPNQKSKRDKMLPYQATNGKNYYFTKMVFKELGIREKASANQPVVQSAKLTKAQREEVVAEVNGKKITVGELFDKINSRPPAWRRIFAKKEKKLEFLNNNIILDMLLYDSAKKSNILNDEVVKDAAKKRMVDLLRREQITKIRASIKVSDKDMENYYNNNKSQFVQPEGMIAAHIVVKTKNEADKILAELKSKKGKGAAGRQWRSLVTKYSIDDKTKTRGGLLGSKNHRVIAQNDTFYDKALVAAIWKLAKNGDIGGPVKTPQGWHIIKRYNKRHALNITFVQAKRRLKRLVERENINKAYKAWINKLKIKYKVKTLPENNKFIVVKVEDKPVKSENTTSKKVIGKTAKTKKGTK